MALRVSEQAFRSDTGRQRTANEDSYYATAPVFAVADGMGGAQAGEVASKIAADSFEPAVRSGESPEAYLRAIAENANARIHSLAQHDSSRSGMGTTLTAAMVEGDEVSFAHVGDSRAYLWRDGGLRLLTSDHSLVEELRRQGRISDEQAEDHPQRSIITRALGPESQVEVDTLTFSARPGDVFLLCSDGLTTMVKDDGIATVLREATSLDDVARTLVDAANEAGGRDNITVVAFRLEDAEAAPSTDDGATLIGPSAEEAGLSAERVRAAAGSRERRAASGEAAVPVAGGRSRWRTAAKVLAVVAVIAGIGVAAVFGARQVYFLGIDEGGRVSLYRGLPYDLPLGIHLYSEVYSIPVQASSIPEDRRDSLVDHDLRSRDDAVSLLDDLQSVAVEPNPPVTSQGSGGKQDAGGQGGKQGGQGSSGNQGK
ncbi:MAG: family protein phosphatase [Solirubrobacterales bacterium]|jgi:protein phosphatase|nr:family protein phosphatase [Solirubrobacterales bacterium]